MSFAIRKYFFLIAALFSLSRVFSQQPDTVVVYEYIYKTDTIWMESKPVHDTIDVEKLQRIEDATIVFDPVSKESKLIYFFPGGAATIPINRILLNENHLKIDKMKRVSFFTMFFLALQSIAYAQPSLNIKGGVSTYWDATTYIESDGLTLGSNVGFEMKGPLAKRNFSLSVGYDYHSFIKDLDIAFFDSVGQETGEQMKIMTTLHSFPLLVYYKINKVELFAGYEFRTMRNDLSMGILNDQLYQSFYFRYEHSLSAGFEYPINNRISILGKYCTGRIYVNKADDKLKVNGGHVDFGIKYCFFRNPS